MFAAKSSGTSTTAPGFIANASNQLPLASKTKARVVPQPAQGQLVPAFHTQTLAVHPKAWAAHQRPPSNPSDAEQSSSICSGRTRISLGNGGGSDIGEDYCC